MDRRERPGGDTVVVGVDGHASGRVAVQWAVEEARRRRLRLHLVQVVHAGASAVGVAGAEVLVGEAEAARDSLDQLKHEHGAELEVSSEVLFGSPGQVLVDVAAEAAMLVVGPRRHGPLGSALLGSVSTYCTHHCACPVVVVARAAHTVQA